MPTKKSHGHRSRSKVNFIGNVPAVIDGIGAIYLVEARIFKVDGREFVRFDVVEDSKGYDVLDILWKSEDDMNRLEQTIIEMSHERNEDEDR